MVYSSPYSTPNATPPQFEFVESSTPWSEILLEDLPTTIRFNTPLRLSGRYKCASNGTSRARLRCWSRVIWLAIVVIIGVWWVLSKGRDTLLYGVKHLYKQPNLDGLQFVDASHPYIRYVGRWTTASDGTHKDGAFAGVYFDFALNGSSTVLLSLYNSDQQNLISRQRPSHYPPNIAFLPPNNISSANPISLLARIDDDEYIVLPNASSIVTIRRGDLDLKARHDIRIIAPMVGCIDTLQLAGLWIDQGGQLLSPGSPNNGYASETASSPASARKYKLLESITDTSGSITARDGQRNIGKTRAILGGVMGWEYLLGEMFSADHVTISMDDMCLIQNCIGGRGSPVGLADVFFQSGPLGSAQYAQPWHFQEYIPDVIVMNLGNSDWDSFQTYTQEYKRTLWELSVVFEETYVSMIKAIRTFAYPKYSSSAVDSSRYSYSQQVSGASIPIFIMRPFRGQLEQATHSVVERLRKDGDKSVFWLDTSGWLNTEVDFEGRAEDQDFFLDEISPSKQWRLTERGHQRVAILLHMHVCRYLARESEKCAFLPPEVYEGKAMDHEAIRLSEYIDDERERKLKKLFWN